MKSISVLFMLSVFALPFGILSAEPQVYRLDNCIVNYENVELRYVEAIARAVQLARAAAVERFAFDMPQTITINVSLDTKYKVNLFNDGNDRMILYLISPDNLLKPSQSGIYHIYGICHEVGHLAMYRVIKDHSWLTSHAAEGWAHYIGSDLVDNLYSAKKDLWPDDYDFSADGMKRLSSQSAAASPSDFVRAAMIWSELGRITGQKGLTEIFKAWGNAQIDPADPAAALRKSLLAYRDDSRLSDWWNKAEPVIVFRRPKSDFSSGSVKASELTGQPTEMKHDDGKQAGKKSIAGSGHAVRFSLDGNDWYLTSVKIYGSRYGTPQAPQENFHVWICDRNFKTITDLPFPYSKLPRGSASWVNLSVSPINVPSELIVCVGFNPTATKGFFLGYDEQSSGNSFTMLPGQQGEPFEAGDWLIRIKADRLKQANPLVLNQADADKKDTDKQNAEKQNDAEK